MDGADTFESGTLKSETDDVVVTAELVNLESAESGEELEKETDSLDGADGADAGSQTDLRIGDPQSDAALPGTGRLLNTNQVESRKSPRCSWHPSDDDYVPTFYLSDSLGVAGHCDATKADRAKVNQTVRISSWDLRDLSLKAGTRMDVLSNSGFRPPEKRRSTPNLVLAAEIYVDNYFDVVVRELRGGFELNFIDLN